MAGSSSSVKIVPLDPDYIKFLLGPDLEFSCYFVVGNAGLAPVEKIGVVRKMLAAHSCVFRAQLLSRQWESKSTEEITDILPATFKNLLRFVYGYDTTATMSFEDADDLLVAADRYIMDRLKDRVVTRLISLLDYTNICYLMSNPACANALELQSIMTKILHCETDKVLTSLQFLSCCTDTFVKILEQEVMYITELEVWSAALRWAKSRAKKEDAKSLRHKLQKPLQHIRLCSLTQDEFRKEVVPTGILTNQEIAAVSDAVVTKKQSETLQTLCNSTRVRIAPATRRNKFSGNQGVVRGVTFEELTAHLDGNGWFTATRELSFSLQTDTLAIELTGVDCDIGLAQFTVTLTIESTQATTTYRCYQFKTCYEKISKYLEERPMVLPANTKYSITLTSDEDLCAYEEPRAVKPLEHFTMEFSLYNGRYFSPVRAIHYILYTDRMVGVCQKTKNVPDTLTTLSTNIQVKKESESRSKGDGNQGVVDRVNSEELTVSLPGWLCLWRYSKPDFDLQTHGSTVELTRLQCHFEKNGQFPVTVTIASRETVYITRTVTQISNNTLGYIDLVPSTSDEKPVVLSPNTNYNISIYSQLGCFHILKLCTSYREQLEHFTLVLPERSNGWISPVCRIGYKVLAPQ